jgi:hypothetical protein
MSSGDQYVLLPKASADLNFPHHQKATFEGAKRFMEAILFTNTLWLILSVVLATGLDNLLAVRVWTAKTSRLGSRPVENPDPLTVGRPNPDPCPSTRGICRVWLDLSVPISGSAFRVAHL